MKTVKLFILVAVLALVVQAHGPVRVQAQDKGVIKIVSHSPLSGKQAEAGIPIKNGAQLAIKQLSEPITKLGFRVDFEGVDDQADPKVGPVNAQRFVGDPAILAVIGHYNSGVARPSSVIYNDANLVMISPANTAVDITDRGLPTVNRVCGRDDSQGAAGAAFAINELKVKSVYIVTDATVYGDGVAKYFRQDIEKGGVKVAGFDRTNATDNFDAVITPILAAKPELIYFAGVNPAGAVFFKQARDKGLTAQFMGPDGFDGPQTSSIAGDAAVGLIYTTTAAPASLSPDAKQFRADYKAEFNVDAQAYAAEAYVSTAIALKAIEKAITDNGGKMPDRKTVAANVRATKDFKSILGTITFDANGDPEVAKYYVLKVGSKDPAKWSDNAAISVGEAKSPLAAAAAAGGAAATAAATMAATQAK